MLGVLPADRGRVNLPAQRRQLLGVLPNPEADNRLRDFDVKLQAIGAVAVLEPLLRAQRRAEQLDRAFRQAEGVAVPLQDRLGLPERLAQRIPVRGRLPHQRMPADFL